MPKARLIVVGATGTAMKRTIPALRGSEICAVTAIQGRNERKLATVAREYGIAKTYLSAEAMFDSERFDVVFIATPPFLHVNDVLLAARYGRPVICEKPLAHTLSGARRIARAVGDARIPFMLAHQVRHQEAFAYLQATLSSGVIGEVRSAAGQWGFTLNPQASNASWKRDPELAGATVFYDAGIHVLDAFLALFGRPVSVLATGFTSLGYGAMDNAVAIFSYPTLAAVASTSQTLSAPANDLAVFGTDGRIEVPRLFGEVSADAVHVLASGDNQSQTFARTNLYRDEIEDFLQLTHLGQSAIRGTTLQDALGGMVLLDAIDRSIQERREVDVPATND